jgi:hypothetical protein
MIAGAQTGFTQQTTIFLMFNRSGKWWQLCATLAVIWTAVVFAYGWLNLPRAPHIQHDPQFLSRLSTAATSILQRTEAKAKRVRGAIEWTDTPRFVRMSNGAQLTFPATTTGEQSALVASEYRELLNAEANKQRMPYLLELLAIWLAPALLLPGGGLAASLIRRGREASANSTTRRGHSPSTFGRSVTSAFGRVPDDRASLSISSRSFTT